MKTFSDIILDKSIRRTALMGLAFATLGTALPTQATAQFAFKPDRPKLVVLLHGVTAFPHEDPAAGINTSDHSRYYWGFDFIKGTQGMPQETQMRTITPWKNGNLVMLTENKSVWKETHNYNHPDQLAPVTFPMSWLNGSYVGYEYNTTAIKDYIRFLCKSGPYAPTMTMVTYRDGAQSLLRQTGQAIDQIYDTYQKTYGHVSVDHQPQIYLTGHSFGGIVIRAILANPSSADKYGVLLTSNQRARADWIAKRTVFVTTMSTPHESTIIPDSSGDIADFVKNSGKTLELAFAPLDALLSWLGIDFSMGDTIRKYTIKALHAISGKRPSLEEIKNMSFYNAGMLHPSTARRGAGGSVVPIYTLNGRNPGGKYFDRPRSPFIVGSEWRPYSILDMPGADRNGFEAFAMNTIQSLLHQFGYGYAGYKPWGKATIPESDRISSPFRGQGLPTPRAISEGIDLADVNKIGKTLRSVLDGGVYGNFPDTEMDSDGFCGWDSGNALNLSGPFIRLYNYAKYGTWLPWDDDHHGSMMFNAGSGQYLYNELYSKRGFLYSSTKPFSSWLFEGEQPIPSHSVKVEVTSVEDPTNSLDTVTQADFQVWVRIADQSVGRNASNNMWKAPITTPWTKTGIPSSVIPIRISVIERDDPSLMDPHDYCTISPAKGRDVLYVYFDTRTQRITGDVSGAAGDIITASGLSGATNRATVRFRITGQ